MVIKSWTVLSGKFFGIKTLVVVVVVVVVAVVIVVPSSEDAFSAHS